MTAAAAITEESAIALPMRKASAPIILDPRDEAWFDLRLMRKDVELPLRAGERPGIPLPAAEPADEVRPRARAFACEPRDGASPFEVLEQPARERRTAA